MGNSGVDCPMENQGYIYILTNPSFKEYVKIGYTKDVDERVKTLNGSDAVPFAFRKYATYKVNLPLGDKKVHEIIDRLNPSLRSIDDIDGRIRKREFYAISAEQAYSVFEAMAAMHGCNQNLQKYALTKNEKEDEKVAAIIRQKAPNKDFYTMGLSDGDEIFLIKKPELKAVVASANTVSYQGGEPMTITALSRKLFEEHNLGNHNLGGFEYFAFDDKRETLYQRYNRMTKSK